MFEIFSLALIICIGIITPYIIILANKDKDYKNKKFFIIYEKAINILLILHIALTLISILYIFIYRRYYRDELISSLILGAVGIVIIYGICYILKKNNISLNINKYLKLERKMNKEKTCKNCGKQISEDFKICPYCGEKVENEILEISCQSCGKIIKSDMEVCPYCRNNPNNKYEVSPKNGIACLLLFLFLGEFGAHRFYAGKIVSGFIMFILSSILSSIISTYILSLLDYLNYLIVSLSRDEGSIIRTMPSFDEAIFISIIPFIILSVWWIIDLISILRDKFKDSKGRYIKLSN